MVSGKTSDRIAWSFLQCFISITSVIFVLSVTQSTKEMNLPYPEVATSVSL